MTMKEIIQINIIALGTPTGGSQTSWLFTSVAEELNSVFREQLQQVLRVGNEPRTSRFQVRRPNHAAMLPTQGA